MKADFGCFTKRLYGAALFALRHDAAVHPLAAYLIFSSSSQRKMTWNRGPRPEILLVTSPLKTAGCGRFSRSQSVGRFNGLHLVPYCVSWMRRTIGHVEALWAGSPLLCAPLSLSPCAGSPHFHGTTIFGAEDDEWWMVVVSRRLPGGISFPECFGGDVRMSGEGRTRRLGAAPQRTPRGTAPCARPRRIGAHTLRATCTFILLGWKHWKAYTEKFSINANNNIFIISSPHETLKLI